ncbi:MAG TPA: glycosyltransferase family 2 protein [Thermoanaerobaculia bacterium]|nr:glycosyltransferase family 2 protein [Thermoanaerobaculia bacterium]
MTRQPTLQIIIVTWNGKEDTIRALDALEPQLRFEGGAAASVIVVDNGSTDGTVAEIGNRPHLRIIQLPENRGFTGGVVAGIAASSADWVILLNNDAVPEPEWLARYQAAAAGAAKDVIAFGGKIIDMTGSLVDFVGGSMTFDGHAFQNGFRRKLSEVEEPRSGDGIFFACGGNMMVRRREFIALEGFDDDYFAYLEDVDFGWRAWLSGWQIEYLPEALVRHRSSATSNRLGNFERGVLFEKNALQTALKNYEDALLGSMSGGLFLTLLHRMHRYVIDRNPYTSGLQRSPLGSLPAKDPQPESFMHRVKRGLTRDSQHPQISDELTVMQFRAIEWFFANSEKIMEKRRRIQSRRVRSDQEIFQRFPLFYIPTYHGDDALLASSLFKFLKPQVPSIERTLAEVIRP